MTWVVEKRTIVRERWTIKIFCMARPSWSHSASDKILCDKERIGWWWVALA